MSREESTLDATTTQAMEQEAMYAGAERLWVRFYTEAVKNEEKSKTEGRAVYEDTEFIEIRVPGDLLEIRNRPVREKDKELWPKQYAAYKKGEAEPLVGTPLELLPFLTKAQIAEFRAAGCRTAEHVRDMPDTLAQKFMGSVGVRKRISEYLARIEANAPGEKMQAELEKRDDEIATLKRALAEQGAKIEALSRPKPKA